MFSGILPRLGNNIEIMSRAIYVNQWLEEWCREESFTFKKQWESFHGQRECFQNDGRILNRKGAARFAVGIKEGIQACFFRSVEGGEAIKEEMDEVFVVSKARQENRISGREKLNMFYTNARSLNNKMEELEAKVDSEEYNIVAVSETWFKEESNWRTGLEGYKVYRCDMKERIRGGVAIWVKDSIASRERGDIKEGINVEDSVCVEIRDCKTVRYW